MQLVCASFPKPGPETPAHLSLLLKAFQSLFPALSPTTLNLSSARRIVLLSYNAEKQTVEFRHYIITVKASGVSKRIRKVVDGATGKARSGSVLNLGREKDIADFFLRPRGEPGPAADDDGYESAASTTSSLGGDDPENTVDLPDNYVGRNNKKGERRAVRLDEIGPRMELSLLKMTEGLPGKEGSVLYHRYGEVSTFFPLQSTKRGL
jgi:ribosome biogenesis protein SSF1/2